MAALIGVGGLVCRRSGLVDESGQRIDDEVLAHVWPTHHENIRFPGTHTVDIAAELATWMPPAIGSCAYPAADRG